MDGSVEVPARQRSVEEALIELGRGWGGVFTWPQAREVGVASATLARKIASGFLTKPHPGIYQVEVLRSPDSPLCAALSAVPGAVLSRETAARIHGFGVPGDDVHLTLEKGAHRRLRGISVHETRLLPPEDRAVGRGMPVTTPARTLVDLASVLRPARFRFILDQQLEASQPTPAQFLACFAALARRGLPGVLAIREQIPHIAGGDPVPQSELERRLDQLLRSVGLDLRRQFKVPWYDGRRGIVDFADPESRTIIEADGLRWHSTRQVMADDRRRDRVAVAHGWVVVRVTWDELVERPAGVAADLAAILASRRKLAGELNATR